MKVIIAVVLYIGRANPCITHNRTGASRFSSGCTNAVAIVVLCMISSKLMPHFMRNVVNIKRISNGRTAASYTTCFLPSGAHNTKTSKTSTVCSEDMSDVIVSTTNHIIYIGLILINHRSRGTICIWVGCCRGINQGVVIGNNHHGDRYIFFVHPIYAVHGNHLSSCSLC